MFCSRYGFRGVFDIINDGKEASKDYFNQWTNDVKNTVPSENLLIFNVKEGWEPLCKFLNLPTPNIPFPRTNDSKTKNSQYTYRKIKAYLAILGLPIVASFIALYYRKNVLNFVQKIIK